MQIDYVYGTDEFHITRPGAIVLSGMAGDMAPDFRLNSEFAGEVAKVMAYSIGTRTLELPLAIVAKSMMARRLLVNDLLAYLATYPGGYLRFTDNDGVARELRDVYLQDGAEDDGVDGLEDVPGAQFVLSFSVSDPFWYEITDTTQTFQLAASTGTFFPIFPLRLTASAVLQRKTVNNPGYTVWPIITVSGPASDIVLKNFTTGKELALLPTLSLSLGDTLVIDTRPLYKTVEKNGVNAFAYFNRSSEFWPLITGDNDISCMMGNSDANTQVDFVYAERYLAR